ncbi:MAG: hypothetical protein K2F87_05650 [Muribaculaceae bacterium]|nr:hypothetical protein [Muribaculaceae bacterium]
MASILSAIADIYRRWRHSRGFGVHSPFAYTLVTDALYPPHGYAYYLENDARLDSADPSESRQARALYRLAVTLRSGTGARTDIYLWPEAPKCYRAALILAGANILASTRPDACAILPGGMEAVRIPTTGGVLTLSGRHLTIIIPGREMADTRYTLP